jgi:hypothetical protein
MLSSILYAEQAAGAVVWVQPTCALLPQPLLLLLYMQPYPCSRVRAVPAMPAVPQAGSDQLSTNVIVVAAAAAAATPRHTSHLRS